jgi:hypothetical protein
LLEDILENSSIASSLFIWVIEINLGEFALLSLCWLQLLFLNW